MKKFVIAALALTSTFVLADELMVADAGLIAELKQYCMEVAQEDGTGDLSMDAFILKCVNEELESEGYKPVASLK